MEFATWEQLRQTLAGLGMFGIVLLFVGAFGLLFTMISMGNQRRFVKALVMAGWVCLLGGGFYIMAAGISCIETKNIEVIDEREELEIVESVPIVTLDGTSYISGYISGQRGRVHGEIHEDDYYTVMAADGNGGYKKRRYDVDCTTILFDSSAEDARVEKVAFIKYRNRKVTYSLFERSYEFPLEPEEEYRYEYRIHVPEGSWGEYQFNVN